MRSRHTSCALVTGVQTCALPISLLGVALRARVLLRVGLAARHHHALSAALLAVAAGAAVDVLPLGHSVPFLVAVLVGPSGDEGAVGVSHDLLDCRDGLARSVGGLVGKECVSTCRSRCWPY